MRLLFFLLLTFIVVSSCKNDDTSGEIEQFYEENSDYYPTLQIVLSNDIDQTRRVAPYVNVLDTIYSINLTKNIISYSHKEETYRYSLDIDELIRLYSLINELNDFYLLDVNFSNNLSIILSVNNKLRVVACNSNLNYLKKKSKPLADLMEMIYSLYPYKLNLMRHENL